MLTPAVDLTSCDSEPIHMIGAIQPFGCLIAADASTLAIGYASANTAAYLGRPPEELLGLPLSSLLGEERLADLLTRAQKPDPPDLIRPWFLDLPVDGEEIRLECLPHENEGRLILEFVYRQEGPAVVWEEDLARQRIIAELIRQKSLHGLAQASAQIIREVTGFDRVMIYRFAADKHGEVIAESTARADSFLGLHYPASDIPDPARRHFVLNIIRTIPDINAPRVPILARAGTIADAASSDPLDLTYSKLRAVAPVHIEYLNNMGVCASMSISLTANNDLWGLVACHHYEPLNLPWSRFRFCELLGGTISALLQSLENTQELRGVIHAERTAFELEQAVRAGAPLEQAFAEHSDDLMRQCDVQGMDLRLDGRSWQVGRVTAPEAACRALTEHLVDGIAATDTLEGLLPGGHPADGEVAGIALLELSEDGRDTLAMLREPFEETITWAGKPDKVAVRTGDGALRLSPRGSFELWREERRGRSKPFTAMDLEILRVTRRALFAVNSLYRERAAVAAQRQAEAEEARLRLALLDAAREQSMGELASALAHELNQPLSAVTNYVNACRQELRNYGVAIPDRVGTLMDSALSESARAADLVRRLRNFISRGEVTLEPADLHALIQQGVELALAAAGERDPVVFFRFADDMPPVMADPVQLVQVVLNLVRNSLTAMRGRERRVITISTRFSDDFAEVAVRDSGTGISPEVGNTIFEPFHSSTTSGMGIGLSLCRSIIEAHGGRIWTTLVNDGAEFAFSVALEADR